MRNQNGCIQNNGKNWYMRFRETVTANGEEKRKLQYKSLGTVTSEHRKNRTRAGELRVPAEIQAAADAILGAVNSSPRASVLLTISELVEQKFFPDAEKVLKPASIENYKFLWNRYLKPRIGRAIVRSFERKDAHSLWQRIHAENQSQCKSVEGLQPSLLSLQRGRV